MPWIDIQSVTAEGRERVWVDVVAIPPSPLGGSSESRIAYGLVFDTDLDGVADVRLGMDRVPTELTPWSRTGEDTTIHIWRTDLRAGTTESGSSDSSVCDCRHPDERRGTGSFYPGEGIPGRFYAWASVIQDGRVVATDYAPDAGWLDSTGSIPGGGVGPTPAGSVSPDQ